MRLSKEVMEAREIYMLRNKRRNRDEVLCNRTLGGDTIPILYLDQGKLLRAIYHKLPRY